MAGGIGGIGAGLEASGGGVGGGDVVRGGQRADEQAFFPAVGEVAVFIVSVGEGVAAVKNIR